MRAQKIFFLLLVLCYTRDIRGGLGERDAFRVMLREMAITNPVGSLP